MGRPVNPVAAVEQALARIEEVDRPEVWISRRPPEDVLAAAELVQRRLDDGAEQPLAGLTVAVKDNIDHAGTPTTAGCPKFSYRPQETAPALARLEAAGAVVLGKTNLDQFATGLVGTRSPYGAVRDSRRPDFVSGGSSSGSAVAVALGMADIGLGTDTAGSGRVPAAFQGIVGIKPTRGLVPTEGIVPACRSLDCVSTFTRELGLGQRVTELMARPPGRAWAAGAPVGLPAHAPVAIPSELPDLEDEAREAFAQAAERLEATGHPLRRIDVTPFLEAGALLYNGAYVAERYAAVGRFIDTHPASVDPIVGKIILTAGRIAAHTLLADRQRLKGLAAQARAAMGDAVALLMPTTTRQPLIAEVDEDPIAVNARLGRYTSFVNLFDMCAVAVPAGRADGGEFGVQVLSGPFGDAIAGALAAELLDEPPSTAGHSLVPPAYELFVVGAHRSGQPLNCQLTDLGAVLRRRTRTAPEYRMHRLQTEPPKPGLRRAPEGVAIEGEVWALSPIAFAEFVAAVPPPMAIGPLMLEDGRLVSGFLCEAGALDDAEDISEHGSWPAFLAAVGAVA